MEIFCNTSCSFVGTRYHFNTINFWKEYGQMNKDLKLYSDIINHLVYLTTKDEYGTIRSRGVETYGHLAEELNNKGIVPSNRGYWTENSIKLFFPRIIRRYPEDYYYDDCDFDFIGRSSWEYQSYTKYEEILDTPHRKQKKTEQSYKKSNPVYTYHLNADEKWKGDEIEILIKEENRIYFRAKKSIKQTRKPKS